MAWKRERGAARGYVNDETGQRLSRRQYDKLQELAGLRKTMTVERLARQRQSQNHYNDLINQYAKNEFAKIDRQLERVEDLYDEGLIPEDVFEILTSGHKQAKRSVKGKARKSPEIKAAIKALKSQSNTPEANAAKVQALKTLGRRHGIPDWVPEGLSDRFRRGKLRRDRVPKSAFSQSSNRHLKNR